MVNLYLYVVGAMVMFSLLAAKKETATWFSVALSVLWPVSFPIVLILGLAMRNKNG